MSAKDDRLSHKMSAVVAFRRGPQARCVGAVDISMRLFGGDGNKILPLWFVPVRISARALDLGFTNSGNPTADYLNTHETTNQRDHEVGSDQTGLSCPVLVAVR